MQNIISAKCLKAVKNIPITAQLECSLTTQTIIPSTQREPADRGVQTLICDSGTCSTCAVAPIFSHLNGEFLTPGN
ncbi:Monocarboxylate transporter 8, partial [Dissostichus eleginoides]